MKLNNKGLVVSAVLYTLLIAFLLFLGITLANFSSSTKIVSNATKDLVNGDDLIAKQVYETYDESNFENPDMYNSSKHTCGSGSDNYKWYQKLEKNKVGQVADSDEDLNTTIDPKPSSTIVRIYSRYGTTYWPRDFSGLYSKINKLEISSCKTAEGNIVSPCNFENVKNGITNGNTPYVEIVFKDASKGDEASVKVSNVCP